MTTPHCAICFRFLGRANHLGDDPCTDSLCGTLVTVLRSHFESHMSIVAPNTTPDEARRFTCLPVDEIKARITERCRRGVDLPPLNRQLRKHFVRHTLWTGIGGGGKRRWSWAFK